jgi:hypothetical protein
VGTRTSMFGVYAADRGRKAGDRLAAVLAS